ncbi:uncharacterized protein EV420DRAFT_1548962 [Desarmillaria tabescens]|uniref:Uncharacterized protein n=1 Tax=Armillaria tabescens TaxID=1929756 RepID=A0AA39KCW5_ARMTA|nr:uncharacterized protein EV420DRAFT_1548962 [Desarmillaria tabescens]KAK0457541.1 hypothetical protein EV420DRAFT_1548962 [Desarmillaria tabescens]
MSSQPSTAIPCIGNTFGVLYVGATIAVLLFGVSNLQMAIYYKRYPNDWSLYRYSVALLWTLDILHVALTTHALYVYLIDMFGDLAGALVNSVWSFKVQLGMNIGIIIYVQGLYAIRLWKLGRYFHKFLPWFAFLAVVASLGAGIFSIYSLSLAPNLSTIYHMKASVIASSTVVVTDFVIAFMMCYYLHKSRAVMELSKRVMLCMRSFQTF